MTRLVPYLLLLGAPCLLPALSIEQYHVHDFSFTAQVSGNPFDVELTGEFTGPGGIRLTVPAFYDGGGVWIVRFSPTQPGSWSLRTISAAPGLGGHVETDIECTPNRDPQIHGGLRVDPRHPHHFIYEDGTRYFLMGYEADWLWAVDMHDPARVEMHKLIDLIASRGFNHVLVNVFAYDTTWSPGHQNRWDYGPPAMYAWAGGNDAPDHSHLNPEYFKLYDGMVRALQRRGIVAHLMFKVYNKLVNWPAPGSRDEERYFRYVTARYQAFSNVVWDFSKESYHEKDKLLEKRLIDLIRSHDAYHRLTTAHDNDVYDWNPDLNSDLDFRSDQQHAHWAQMIAFDRNLRQWPVVNVEFGYEQGVDPFQSYRVNQDWKEVLRRAYLIYLAGGYGAYYYHNTAWDIVKVDPAPPGMKRFQLLKETLSALPYWRMTPSNDLAVGGPCLALPGEIYAFFVQEKNITVNLNALDGPAAAEWIDTWTGARQPLPIPRPAVYTLDRPESFGNAPALLIVRAQH